MARDRSFDNEEFSPQTGDTLRQDGRIFNIADAELEARSPFGRSGVYELTNQISFSSFRSFSIYNDHEATASNSASRSIDSGNLVISTGTTAGSVYRYETAPFGTYQSGKAVQAGIGCTLEQALSGDAQFRAGVGTADDSAHFRFTANDIEAVFRAGGTELSAVSQSDWNVDTLDGSNDENNPSGLSFDPTTQGFKVEIIYTWYSFGPVAWRLVFPDPNEPHEMQAKEVHRERPSQLNHFENPDLPPFAEIDNGTTTADFRARIGGRTFDVFGEFQPDTRTVASITRTGQSITSAQGIVPLVGLQRKAEFPTGVQNTVTAYINSRYISTDQQLRVAFYSVATTGDLTGSNFGGFDEASTGETSLQGDNESTAVTIANAERVSPEFIIESGSGNQVSEDKSKGLRVPIIRDRPTMLMANNISGTDATDIDSAIAATELF